MTSMPIPTRREMTVSEALDAFPATVNERGAELANEYQMPVTVASSVGLVLAELYRDGLISWTVPAAAPDGEATIRAVLEQFGWTCTDEFWKRYYSDAWVFNLVNALIAAVEAA